MAGTKRLISTLSTCRALVRLQFRQNLYKIRKNSYFSLFRGFYPIVHYFAISYSEADGKSSEDVLDSGSRFARRYGFSKHDSSYV